MDQAKAEKAEKAQVVQGPWGKQVPAREFLAGQLASVSRQEAQAAATLEQARGARQAFEFLLSRCGPETMLQEPSGKPEEKQP